MEIWRAAVDATHDFLSGQDRNEIDVLVCGFLPDAPMWLAVDSEDVAVGFMMLTDAWMQALFVHPHYHRKGVGRLLVEHAMSLHPTILTDVNEQNTQAVQFYEAMGFELSSRSATDDAGRPYPLLHLRHGASA